MIERVVQIAVDTGWASKNVHREYFANQTAAVRAGDQPFEVIFQRSAKPQ